MAKAVKTAPVDEAPKTDAIGQPKNYVVIKSFRDKDNYSKVYVVGATVNHLDKNRLAHLQAIGYVKHQ